MERIPTPIYWVANSKAELLAFPDDARQDAGYQLHRLQTRATPQDWKPLKGMGKAVTGIHEVRVWQDNATFRIAYVTKFRSYIVVLYCWQKTTAETAQRDKNMIVSRYNRAKEKLK